MITNKNPEYFLTVIREGSFSKAAEKLYISQPYLSQHIKHLEKEFNSPLIDRRKTPLEPTPAGRVYQSYLENSHYLYQKMRSDLDVLNGGRESTLRIGIGTWRGATLIPAILPEFLRTHANTRVDLHEYPVNCLPSLLLEDTFDFAIMNTAIGDSPEGLTTEIILHERVFLVLNRNLPEYELLSQSTKDGGDPDLRLLTNLCLVSLKRILTVGEHVNNYLERNYLNFANRLYTTNTATLLALVDQKVGFCFMVESGLSALQLHPELVAFPLYSEDLRIPLAFLWRKDTFLSPYATDCMALIRAHYAATI